MSGSINLPTVMTSAGLSPQAPADLNTQLITEAQALSPGLTANLPGSLIEDLSSTATGALVLIDQARVDVVNSITPYGANPFILNQLGQIYGVPLGIGSNTSVYVVFTGPPGYVIQEGFIIADALNPQYVIQDGGIIGTAPEGSTTGVSQPMLAISNQPGTWYIVANSVTTIVTSVPTVTVNGIATPILTVNNPLPGTPSAGPQAEEDYRTQVLQAGLATAQGMPTFVKSRLLAIPGVQARLVSMRKVGNLWEILCGGSGDPYLIAYAIFRAMDNIAVLTGSTISVVGITQAAAAVVTTNLNHGYVTGATVTISGVTGMTGANGTWAVTVLTPTTFSIPYNSTSAPAYVASGMCLPNYRNVVASVQDTPDTYDIPFVVPPQQSVTVSLVWNTISTNIISTVTVTALGQAALAGYINAIVAGQPMNVFEMNTVFQQSVAALIPPQQLTTMIFTVFINGFEVAPEANTGIIISDPESYFEVNQNQITITQGN